METFVKTWKTAFSCNPAPATLHIKPTNIILPFIQLVINKRDERLQVNERIIWHSPLITTVQIECHTNATLNPATTVYHSDTI